MSDITANVVVSMPSQLFTMARSFKAVANGKIYIGKIDTDPVNPENQIQVYVENEDGSHIPVSQPIIINAGGYPVYNGRIAKFVTVEGHSMAIYDAYGSQQFYFPNVLKYDPDQFEKRFRDELASNSGAGLIGTDSGETVQDEINEINARFDSRKINPFFDHTVQSILRCGPIAGESGDAIAQKTGITKGNLYSSGIAVDEQTGEIFIVRTNYVSPGGQDAWVDIYDKNFNHQKTIGMGKDFPEGLIIGYVNGIRKVAIGMSTGYGVYFLPKTSDLVNLSVLTPEFTQPSTNHLSQMSNYKDNVIVWNNNLSQTGAITRGLFSVYDKSTFLTTPNPPRISFITAPTLVGGSASADKKSQASKTQGCALTPYGLTLVGGQIFDKQNQTMEAGKRLRITDVNISGDVVNDYMFYPNGILDDLTNMGFTQTDGKELRLIEAEGVIYSDYHGLLALYSSWDVEFVVKLGEKMPGKRTLDLKSYIYPQAATRGFFSYQGWGKPINPSTGQFLDNVDAVCDYMDAFGVREYSFNTGNASISIGGKTYNTNTYFRVINSDHAFFEVDVWSPHSAHKQESFYAAGNSPRRWLKRSLIVGGEPLNSATEPTVQIGANQFPQIRYVYPGANNNTSAVFINDNGQIGSIANTATATMFNTTSDEDLKNKHGEIKDATGTISSLIDSGAVQLAAFKTEPDKIMPMFLAQRTQKIIPEMVAEGHGKVGDDDFVPFSVDKSAITPYLVAAIYELTEKVKVLEARLAERDA